MPTLPAPLAVLDDADLQLATMGPLSITSAGGSAWAGRKIAAHSAAARNLVRCFMAFSPVC
jgi:hypothetical protein